MDSNWLWLIGLVALAAGVVIFTGVTQRNRLRQRLLRTWGQLPEARRSDSEASLAEAYEASRQLRPVASTVDALTWHDLDMQAVFKRLNQTESSVGAEALYAQLHGFNFGQPAVDEALIDFFATDAHARLQVRTAFAHLGKSDHNQSQRYLLDATHQQLPHAWRYRVLGLLPVAGLALLLVAPLPGLLLLLGSLLFNLVYYQQRREQLTTELNAMRYLVQTIAAAKAISRIATPRQAALREALAPMRGVTRQAFVFRTKTGAETEVLADYLGILFMLPFIAYNAVLHALGAHRQAALDLWAQLGALEVAIAIANFRVAAPVSCLPTFAAGGVAATGLVHPLLPAPVANPLDWQQSALITGSNASGKSTYVKSVAINCILAQTVNTATATAFTLAPGHVVTAMAIQDDLDAGDSYFIAEIKAIRRVLHLAATGERVYGFIDEILKGTNTVERIAASASVVSWLTKTDALTLVATHDGELSRILGAAVTNWHFQETVDAHGVSFDYRLHQGPATSHNAIALLATLDYPRAITAQAHELAADFERTTVWPQLSTAAQK